METVEALKAVLAEGYSIDVMSSSKKTPLHVAVNSNTSALPVLLKAGCDVTAPEGLRGNTPLHTACTLFNEEAIHLLVKAGSRLNAKNWLGQTPLHCLLQHAYDRHSFHARSRQNLARRLIYIGMYVIPPKSPLYKRSPANRGDYKTVQLYRQLCKESRQDVYLLQHLCRLKVRDMCENSRELAERNLEEMVEELELSDYLKEYLLYKQHGFVKDAF